MGYFTELRDIVAGNFIGEIRFISQKSRFFYRQEVASIINEIQWPNFSIGWALWFHFHTLLMHRRNSIHNSVPKLGLSFRPSAKDKRHFSTFLVSLFVFSETIRQGVMRLIRVLSWVFRWDHQPRSNCLEFFFQFESPAGSSFETSSQGVVWILITGSPALPSFWTNAREYPGFHCSFPRVTEVVVSLKHGHSFHRRCREARKGDLQRASLDDGILTALCLLASICEIGDLQCVSVDDGILTTSCLLAHIRKIGDLQHASLDDGILTASCLSIKTSLQVPQWMSSRIRR